MKHCQEEAYGHLQEYLRLSVSAGPWVLLLTAALAARGRLTGRWSLVVGDVAVLLRAARSVAGVFVAACAENFPCRTGGSARAHRSVLKCATVARALGPSHAGLVTGRGPVDGCLQPGSGVVAAGDTTVAFVRGGS